jgi:ribosomal protein S8
VRVRIPRFQLLPYHLNYVNNHLNFAFKNRSLFTYIKFSKNITRYVEFLNKLKIISSYTIIFKNNKYFIKINLNYFKNFDTSITLKIISKPKHVVSISLTALKLVSYKMGNSVLLLSTSIGYLSHHQALKKKMSGIVIAFIN